MNIQKKQFNKETAENLRTIAYRSIAIIDALQQGKEDREIIKELGCERSLVYYYIKKLTK